MVCPEYLLKIWYKKIWWCDRNHLIRPFDILNILKRFMSSDSIINFLFPHIKIRNYCQNVRTALFACWASYFKTPKIHENLADKLILSIFAYLSTLLIFSVRRRKADIFTWIWKQSKQKSSFIIALLQTFLFAL